MLSLTTYQAWNVSQLTVKTMTPLFLAFFEQYEYLANTKSLLPFWWVFPGMI